MSGGDIYSEQTERGYRARKKITGKGQNGHTKKKASEEVKFNQGYGGTESRKWRFNAHCGKSLDSSQAELKIYHWPSSYLNCLIFHIYKMG